MNYLVRVIPQRGFETRRRSGLTFSVQGTVIGEDQLTPEIEADPGLVVTPVADAEADALRDALRKAEAGEGSDPDPGTGGRPQCAYIRANGEQCKGRAKAESRFCSLHTDDGDGGATVVKA